MTVYRHGERCRAQGYNPETGQAKNLGIFATETEARNAETAWYGRPRRRRAIPVRKDPRGLHTVYRCFDDRGRLVYVGLASNGIRRLHQHERDKSWWPTVATISVAHFASRQLALDEEARAISEEGPKHNKVGKDGPPKLSLAQRVLDAEVLLAGIKAEMAEVDAQAEDA